jgi:hypothetical protein
MVIWVSINVCPSIGDERIPNSWTDLRLMDSIRSDAKKIAAIRAQRRIRSGQHFVGIDRFSEELVSPTKTYLAPHRGMSAAAEVTGLMNGP